MKTEHLQSAGRLRLLQKAKHQQHLAQAHRLRPYQSAQEVLLIPVQTQTAQKYMPA